MRVRLNLATSPLASTRRFAVGATLAGFLGLALLAVLSWRAYTVWRGDTDFRKRQSALQAQIDELSDQRRALETFFNQPESIKRRDRAAFLNSLIAQRTFPWTQIFTDLERMLPEGVRVISIEPRMVGDDVQLKLVVGALSDESKLKFLKTLELSKVFSHIQLVEEVHPARAEQADKVTMVLLAWYSAT